jgi:hypothetical protein
LTAEQEQPRLRNRILHGFSSIVSLPAGFCCNNIMRGSTEVGGNPANFLSRSTDYASERSLDMKFKISLLTIALALAILLARSRGDTSPQARKIKREKIEWCDTWMPASDNAAAPRVLLIGDSISRGYYQAVETILKGKAYCARLSTSKGVGDPALAMEITTFLSESNYDVIHFNIGLHGWGYTEDDYRQYLPELLDAIRKSAPNAKLIWASTTPVKADVAEGPSNNGIAARNAIAQDFFQHQGIAIDDLNALMSGHQDLHSDNYHYKEAGYSLAAKQVAEEITKAISALSK